MKNITLTFFMLLLANTCFAGEKVEKTIDFKENGYIDIENVNGKIEVIGWKKKQVKVKGELADNVEKFTFERSGSNVKIKVDMKNQRGWFGNNSSRGDGDDLKIYIPIKSNLSFESVNAQMITSNVEGDVKLGSVNGEINAQKITGSVEIETVNGKAIVNGIKGALEIESVNGSIISKNTSGNALSVETVNGSIELQTTTTEIDIESVSGKIDLALGDVTSLKIESVSSSARAALTLAHKGTVSVESVSGNIDLMFNKDPSAHIEIEMHAGGSVNNKLSDHGVKKQKYGPQKLLNFSINGGNGLIKINTLSGNVLLDQK